MADSNPNNSNIPTPPPTEQPQPTPPVAQPTPPIEQPRIISQNRPPRHPTPAAAVPGVSPPDPTPDGSVVNATPLPLTPGVHRRELGIAPVRLTPRSNATTPDASGPNAHTPSTPGEAAAEELVLWGTTINVDDAETRLTKFVTTFKVGDSEHDVPIYLDLLTHLAETGGSVVNVDMMHLNAFDPGMYRKLINYPNELVSVFDAVVEKVFTDKFPEEAEMIREKKRTGLQVRTFNLLPTHVQSMRNLNPKDIATLVGVRGMVIRASNVIPDIQRAMYRCTKCQNMRDVAISYGRIEEPRKCTSCNTRDSYTLIHSRSSFSDKQTVRLQEAPEAIPKGETPATFTLIMYDSLVDAVKPGDRVEVTGILRATPIRINPKLRTVRSVYRTYIDCVHVRVLNNNQSRAIADGRQEKGSFGEKDALGQPEKPEDNDGVKLEAYTEEQKAAKREYFETLSCHPALYDRLAASLAPSIFGMTDEKKGVLLQLFGGASKAAAGEANEEAMSDGSARFRSAINVLLVGDPGTSKSQLLHCAHRLAPRGVYTSGRGSSAVGLTAYVTRDPDSDDYVLESGALVLSDRGVCCIDEFDKMSEFARSVLHEAMEQQTVSIAKAGIIATLNARTAVLAAANPINSRYDASKSVVDNIDLPPTLLSRFDLIYLVLDAPNAEDDRRLAKHIVSLFFKNYSETEQKAESDAEDEDDDVALGLVTDAPQYTGGDLLNAQTLTEYIAFAREKVDPKLSNEASEALVSGYLEMRGAGRGGGNITATPRQLESLIRLAEAHARMQLKEEVEESDVEEAMRLVKSALHMAAYDPNTGKIDMGLFAAGKSRAVEGRIEMLGRAIVDMLGEERYRGKVVKAPELLASVRKSADVDVALNDFRDALRRLEEMERVALTGGGSTVRLIS